MSRSTVFDNTERKQIDEALRRANLEMGRALRMKDEFLANMSHELRTPLNGILTFSELLLQELQGPINERQRKSLANVYSSGEHLLALINDLLDLSKIEAGKQELHPEEVFVDEVCQASLMMVRGLAQTKRLHVGYTCNQLHASIYVDPKRLKQMLVNLLSNGVKFTPEGGKVHLHVEIDAVESVVRFAVQDTGIGIAAEDMPKLFQPFVQLDAGLSRRYEGTGLGLALVKRLAILQGGDITVESSGVRGEGSCFTITLPCLPPPSAATSPDAAHVDGHNAPRVATGNARTLVLLAEDNEMMIVAMSSYLEHLGHPYIVARTGPEALTLAQTRLPDLILMDVQLPLLDGLQVIRRLRSDPRFRTTPIVALTALAMSEDRQRCLDAGATEYLSKPIRLLELSSMLTSLLVRNVP